MTIAHQIVLNWSGSNGQTPITNTTTLTGQGESNWDGQIPASTYGENIALAWTASKLQDLYILSDQALTFKTNGTLQVTTATVVAASGITGNGNATVVVTGAILTGSPVTYSIPVTTAANTAALAAGVIRTYLGLQAAVIAKYTVGGTGADITLTALLPAANDATLNVSTANGSCTGLTTEASSAATTAGAVPQDTISLAANVPFVWITSGGESFPFLGAVTTTYFANAGGTAANLKIRSLSTSP